MYNSLSKVENELTGNEERKWLFLVIHTHKHHALLYNSPTKVENGLDRKREKKVLISTPTYTHTKIMHFCTTHRLKLRMNWAGNEKRKWSFLVLHIHTQTSCTYVQLTS